MASPKKKTLNNRKSRRIVPNKKEFKRTKPSLSYPCTLNVIKALRKTRSLNNQTPTLTPTPTPTPSCSSPKSVKKPISENVQKQISKKRLGRKHVTTPNNTQGLKLLKRGCVTMHRILRRKIMGIKLTVNFNEKGEPFGDEATEMQSYIEVLARTKPPIWHENWKCVPGDIKTKIWDCVLMAFVLPPSAKKMVIQSAGQRWREFKCRLTKNYILPYRDQPEILAHPPADFSFIEKTHWDLFVADRLSPEFFKCHLEQAKKRESHIYPHRMSRKGYANLEYEWSQSHPDEEEIDRSETWLRARMDKEGNFLNDAVAEKDKKILKLKEEVKEGKLKAEGLNDVLTMALGKPEHGGKVRGQGTHVKQSVYFDLPRQKKARIMDEKINERVQKYMAEETAKIIKDRDVIWADVVEKLKTKLLTKTVHQDGSPKQASQQASCQSNNVLDLGIGVKNLDTPETARKIFHVQEDHEDVGDIKDDNKVAGEDENCKVVGEASDCRLVVEKKIGEEVKVNASGGSVCKLAVGSLSNIVAYAKIDEVLVLEGHEQTIHGVRLGEENASVSITQVIQRGAKIPFPIGDEIVTVEQAIRTFIAWLRNLIAIGNNSTFDGLSAPKKKQKGHPKKMKKTYQVVEDVRAELVVEMDENYPYALKRLWTWAKDALAAERNMSFELSEAAFGSTNRQVIFLSDIHALCSGGEMAGSLICLFINLLNKYVKKHKMTNMISFVDPSTIGATGCGNAGQRSCALAARFKNANKDQYFLMPYNEMNHWTLTVANPEAEIFYYMDPLKRRIANGEWVDVVDNDIKMYKDGLNRVAKKKILWENMAGVPLQTGSKDCGMFVMRYMKEIVEDKELQFAAKWMRRSNLVYTDNDINEIRSDIARYLMNRHAY